MGADQRVGGGGGGGLYGGGGGGASEASGATETGSIGGGGGSSSQVPANLGTMSLASLTTAPSVEIAPAPQTFTLGASSLGAGGDPSLTLTSTLDSTAGTPQTVTIELAPGLLVNANANPSCLTGAPQLSSMTLGSGCYIANGTVTTALPSPFSSIPFQAYIVAPPTSADLAGVDVVTSFGTLAATFDVRSTPTVGLNLSLPLTSFGSIDADVAGITVDQTGTLNGVQFTRLPTSCTADKSTLSVLYSGSATPETTVNATPLAATPTGCSSLGFSPTLAATVTRGTTATPTSRSTPRSPRPTRSPRPPTAASR